MVMPDNINEAEDEDEMKDIFRPATAWSRPPTAQQQFGDRVNHHDLIVPGCVSRCRCRCPRPNRVIPSTRLFAVLHVFATAVYFCQQASEKPRVLSASSGTFWCISSSPTWRRSICQFSRLEQAYLRTSKTTTVSASSWPCIYNSSCPPAGQSGTVPGARRVDVAGARGLNPTSLHQTASSSQWNFRNVVSYTSSNSIGKHHLTTRPMTPFLLDITLIFPIPFTLHHVKVAYCGSAPL